MEKKYRQISLEERCEIYWLNEAGVSVSEIARKLGRSKSTISRELRRNASRSGGYKPSVANKKALAKRHIGHYKLDRDKALKCYILDRLGVGWSPQTIAGRLCYEEMPAKICAETIYNYIHESGFGRKHQLWQLLCRRKPRRSRLRSRKRRGKIAHRISIHARPDCIEKRLEAGHLEADLVLFGRGRQNLITLIDRKTRYLAIINNQRGKNSENIINKIKEKTMKKPPKSITFDNGLEFAKHYLLNKNGVDTYFCDPYSSWQKGSIEHANGLIRRFLPKNYRGILSDNMVAFIEQKINNMPRKILGYQTPAEAHFELTNRCT
jgi:IS30 family transposase